MVGDGDEGRAFDDPSAVRERIDDLRKRAREDDRQFLPPSDPPDEACASEYLRRGAGQVIALYAHLRTGGRLHAFSEEEFDALEEALNIWLRLYAACYGHDIDPAVSIRSAAEALIETEDISAVARVVTGIPERA